MITIVTHDGSFHTDDVSAVAMMRNIYPDARIIRSRDLNVINSADIVLDVGGVYDPDNNRFDHHQSGCNERWKPNGTKLSSLGMAYKKFAVNYIYSVNISVEHEFLNEIIESFYERYVREVDAIDNGEWNASGNKLRTNISSIIPAMTGYATFEDAVNFADIVMKRVLQNVYYYSKTKAQSKILVQQAFQHQRNPQILEFDNHFEYSMMKYIKTYEKTKILFLVYPSFDQWNCKAIPENNFKKRAEVQDIEYLRNVVKNPNDILFVHNKKFIAAAKTKETALEIAKLSIKK